MTSEIPLARSELEDIAQRELERRRKIGAARRGKPLSPDQRARIGDGMRRAWARRKAALASAQRAIETA